MASVNKIVLIGTVTDKPQTRFGMENNSSMAKFVISVDRPTRADGTNEADFIPIVAWGKNADYTAEYLNQGSLVIVEGKIHSRSFEENGQREYVTEVNASLVKSITGKSAEAVKAATAAPAEINESIAQNPFDNKEPFTEDDVPF